MATVSGSEAQDLAIDLTRFAASVDRARLSGTVVDAVKRNIGDTLSCGLAGSSANGVEIVADLVTHSGVAHPKLTCSCSADACRLTTPRGSTARCVTRDYDDTYDEAMLHAGVSSIPAAIAAGQLRGGVTGANLIAAAAAGLEITCRLGRAVTVDIVVETGFIYSSLLGYFGATAATGRAFGLTEGFRDGQTLEARVNYSKGHPNNPMTPGEFTAKTRDCASVAARPLNAEAVDRFTSTVSELESGRYRDARASPPASLRAFRSPATGLQRSLTLIRVCANVRLPIRPNVRI